MSEPLYPSLYQINTRVWLTQLSRELGRPATLDDIPDANLDQLTTKGFDWVWFLSVWQMSQAGQRVARQNPEWAKEFQATLPDLKEEDICGSGFAIGTYTVSQSLGGDAALARLLNRLHKRSMRLMIDFVANHTGLDHPWAEDCPEYYIPGTESDLARAPGNYTRVHSKQGNLILANGRDPYFAGWPDTLQLNYGDPATGEAMIEELLRIAVRCDGVRCDMAMLVLPEVFQRTWGIRAQPFWRKAVERVREKFPDFCFMAEVYWDLEWTMQQLGFDYTYDKRLYDRLRDGHARSVREHFHAGLDYQNKLVRFLENHDEPRAAATFSTDTHHAAAVVTYLSPSLRFFHQGQLEGRRKRISPHICRAPEEPFDEELNHFYERLLAILRQPIVRQGQWQLLECAPAWEGNWTWHCFLAFAWQGSAGERLLVAVNYAPNQSQCYVRLPFADLGNHRWHLDDLIGNASYDRDGADLQARGLYLDVLPWNAFVFSLTKEI